MQALPNNCRVGKFSVSPANWEAKTADSSIPWRIVYWFYDDNLNQKRQVVIKGMNHIKNLKEKQDLVRFAIKTELQELRNGYNPLTKRYADEDIAGDITQNTGLIDALSYALKNVTIEHNTRIDLTNTLKYLFQSIRSLHYERMPVGQVLPVHIKRILDGCEKIKTYTDKKGNVKPKTWGPYQFNRNRTYLSLLFSYLIENFIITMNPVLVIKKKEIIKKMRETTTHDERKEIKELTNSKELYSFYRFIEIYFHSGRRVTELLAVKKEDVRLADQRFKVTMKKGKKLEEVPVTIKTIALPFWKEIYNEAKPGQYLFSEGLVPGHRDKPIRGEQISRRWRRHVKHKLGITADFASLKHSNLDDIAKYFGNHGTRQGILEAQKAAGHSTPVITMTYLPGQEERNHLELKDIANEL